MASVEQVEEEKLKENDELKYFLGEAVQAMREKKELTDVIFVCDGGEVEAHRVILSARSPYFRKMFVNNFKESTTNQVDYSHIKKDIMRQILDYIYLNSMENISDDDVENLIDVYQVSHLFEIKGLSDSCWKLILNRINADNWLSIWELVLLHGINEEIVRILHFILDNVSEIKKRNYFVLSKSQLMTLLEKMNENNLRMEDKLLEAIIEWNKNTKEEKFDLETFFLKINFDFISFEFMTNLLENEKDLFRGTFFKLFERHVLPKLKTRSAMQSLKTTLSSELMENKTIPLKFFYFSCYRMEINQYFLYENAGLRIFDCEKRSVRKIINNLPFLFGRGIIPIQHGSDIYIIGGVPSGIPGSGTGITTKSFFLYDWKNNKVVMKPSLLEEVSKPLTCVSENKMYTFDYDYKDNLMTIQYFSLSEQKWFAKKHQSIQPKACASLRNVIYLLCCGDSSYFHLYVVNQLDCTFHSKTPLAHSFVDSRGIHLDVKQTLITVCKDKMFVLFGDSLKYQWYIFDPDTRLWKIIRTSIPYEPLPIQCLTETNNSLMFYNTDDHSLSKFGKNNTDIKKIMTVKGSLEHDENLTNLGYHKYETLMIFQPSFVK